MAAMLDRSQSPPVQRVARMPSDRVIALDIFRGLAVAGMVLVNSSYYVSGSYTQLLHQPWNGWTFADTIFPAFLWIVGFSITLSFAGRQFERGARRRILTHAIRRATILFVLGMLLQPLPWFNMQYVYVTGVLQKIAVCYLVAVVLVTCSNERWLVVWVVAFQVVYVALMVLVPVPGCQDGPWARECNVASYVNEALRQSGMWFPPREGSPDNVITSISAVSTVLLGIVSGRVFLGLASRRERERAALAGGGALVLCGLLLATWIPINKPLWTTSYVVFMAGLSTLAFGACAWLAPIAPINRLLKPFEILGLNAIAAYALSIWGSNVPKVHVLGTSISELSLRYLTPANASLCYAMTNVAGVYAVVYFMYRRGWFLRI